MRADRTTVMTGMVAATALLMSPACWSHEHEGTKAGGHETESAPMKIPATLAGVWTAVKADRSDLDVKIGSGKLGDVHHLAYAIRDLVAAMPKKTKGLAQDQRAKLTVEVRLVKRLAAKLDEAGDAGDAAKTKALAADLDGELKKIEALYPAGKLTDSAPVKAAVLYVCPMHPEETSDKPGKCSKCGMDLVAKK